MAKVLAVDDNSVVRELLRQTFEADGHVVIEGEDGVEAVEKFRTDRPDLVFLDIRMPRMDGIEALQKILELDSEAKVVMLTAFDDSLKEEEARKAGALNFLRKGAGFKEFMAVAKRLLARATRDNLEKREALARVLLAGNEPSTRDILKRFLEEKGYEVETAGDGNETLAKVKNYRPHVLISDIETPGMSGLGLLEELRESNPSMNIIVVSEHPAAIQDYPVVENGNYIVVLKPLNLEYLETSVLPKITTKTTLRR